MTTNDERSERIDLDNVHPSFEGVREAIRDAETIPPDQLRDLLARAGRAYGPYLLSIAWDFGRIDRDTLTRNIGDVWNAAEFPDATMSKREWVRTFRDAGFTRNGEPAERPTQPVTLYRGASHKRRRLMSWTTDRAVAVRFAERRAMQFNDDCSVWRTVAPPAAILCINDDDNSRGESEYVIDTRGLQIVEDEPAAGTAS